MAMNDEHAPHNRTSLTEAISGRVRMERVVSRRSEPIFPDPGRVKEQDTVRVLRMLRDHLRSQVDPATGLPFQKARQHTLGFLEASARILAMFGREAQADALVLIRDDVETGTRSRLSSFLAGTLSEAAFPAVPTSDVGAARRENATSAGIRSNEG